MSQKTDKLPIRETIKQHDRYQFETRFDYFLNHSKSSSSFHLKNKEAFSMQAYFFIPKLIGINVETYKQSHFYEDIRPLLRFKEPQYSYSELSGLKPERDSGFLRIEELLQALQDRSHPQREVLKHELVDLIKYFSSNYVSNFRRKIRKRCRAIKEHVELGRIDAETDEQLKSLHVFLKRYFTLFRKFGLLRSRFPLHEDMREAVVLELMLAEEYCFYRFREGVASAVETTRMIRKDGQSSTHAFLVRKLQVWSRLIHWFEHSKHFISIGKDSPSADCELFLSRLGNIKKYLSRVLYLEFKPNMSFAFRLQAGYMVAAGLAAFWYFIANVMIFYYLQFGGFGSFGEIRNFLGLSGGTVVISFIVAYILKDRIKEYGRVRFRSGLFSKTPDHLQDIYYTNDMGKKFYAGKMSESIEFIRNISSVPSDIRKLRERGEFWEDEDQFDILFYNKKMEFDVAAIQKIRPKFFSVKHIVRFSIRRFLTKLDDPIQIYLGLDKKGDVEQIGMPKVYYVGLAVTYQSHESQRISGYDYQILVLDKNGLVRIDEVAKSMRAKDDEEDDGT